MPLTKHLYREDETVASVKWSIMKGRFPEIVFWVQECLDSKMVDECMEALLWVWLYGCGPSALSWFRRFRAVAQTGIDDEETVVNLAVSLGLHCRRTPDSSAFALLGMGLMEGSAQEEILGHTCPSLPADATATEIAFAKALIQGKAPFAWRLVMNNWSPRVWDLIRIVAAAKFPERAGDLEAILTMMEVGPMRTPHQRSVWQLRAVAIAAVAAASCQISEELDYPLPDLFAERDEWLNATMRFRRIYTPQTGCLYWFTERGGISVYTTNTMELTHNLEAALAGSKYWSDLVPELTASDTRREIFYDTHFPYDIPDEWSEAEREKSHGRGLHAADSDRRILFTNCLERWFLRIPSLTVWQGTRLAITEFAQRWAADPPASMEDGILHEYHQEALIGLESKLSNVCLTPRRREFTVI
jgi:hypothetical protein